MSNPLNMQSTMLETMADRALIQAIAKALIAKGHISAGDIASELSKNIQDYQAVGNSMLATELKNILGSVVTW